MRRRLLPCLGCLVSAVALTASAQDPDPQQDRPPALLDFTDTEAGRSPAELLETPLSISVVSREELRARPLVGLEETIDLVPGVFAQSSRNSAQDTRISIRGFGARSSFGIRGIKILVDGIPTTLPDGQSEVDSLDLAFTERIDVVRGPASSLYGNASGGVVAVETLQPTDEPRLRLRSLYGSDHLQRQEGVLTGTHRDVGYVLGLAYLRYGGYRDHASAEQTTLLSKLQHELHDGTRIELEFTSVFSPVADDPGALNAIEVGEDRRQARARALQFDTGERLDQQRASLRVRRPLGEHGEHGEIGVTAYYLDRSFRNALPFVIGGRVRFDRNVGGGSITYSGAWRRLSWATGFDLDIQEDDRNRYDNLDGGYGALVLDQIETVRGFGAFGELDVQLGGGWGLVAGARWDRSELEVSDRFLSDSEPGGPSDESDRTIYRELSPRLGIYFRHSRRFFAYLNYSTAFQIPTTTELAPTSGIGGFDSDIDPERTVAFELGAKGVLAERLFYDAAVFSMRVRDAIVPFEVADRSFFTNAGEVYRRGLEIGIAALLHRWVSLRASYTLAKYYYHDFDRPDLGESYDGNRETNTPRHNLASELRFDHPSGLFAVLGLRYFSYVYANDANTVKSDGATTSDIRLGWELRRWRATIRPFVGARNWSNARYNGTIRPNATFGRYFEPAPEAELYAGIEVDY